MNKIILIAANAMLGASIARKIIEHNDDKIVVVESVKENEEQEKQRGLTMNIVPHKIETYDYDYLNQPTPDFNKQHRKGGKKNKKNWRY